MEPYQQKKVQTWRKPSFRDWPANWNMAKQLALPGAVILLIALGWYFVVRQYRAITQATITAYQQTELEIVHSVARSVKIYAMLQIEVLGRTDIAAIEQEIYPLFIEPVRLLENGYAWVYTPERLVFEPDPDFPEEYQGKSAADLFALQAGQGARHYEAMVEAIMAAREGVDWYIWQPERGRMIAAWTPVTIGDYTWVIGISTPLAEILEANGDTSQIRSSIIIMSLGTALALAFLAVWSLGTYRGYQASKALADSNILYQSLVNTLPRRIYRKDQHGRFTFGNQAFLVEVNRSLADIVGKTDFDFYPDEVAQKHQQDDHQVIKTGTILETVEEHSLPGGQKRYIQTIKSPIHNSLGEITGVQGISWDITQHRQAELERERLLAAEREQRLLAETLGEVFLALTAKTSYEAVLDEILNQARRLVAHSAANIMLLHKGVLKTVRWQGYETFKTGNLIANLEQPLLDFPLDAHVIQSRRPLVIPDVQQEPHWITTSTSPWIKSFMAVPICLHDRVLGILRLDSDIRYNFSPQDIDRLQPLANAAAIALENARLYEQAQQELARRKETEIELVQRNAELLTLLYAGATLSTSLDTQVVLETITREMANLLEVKGCLLSEWNEDTDRISLVAGFGLEELLQKASPAPAIDLVDFSLARRALIERSARQITLTQSEISPAETAYMKSYGLKTLLILPMEFQNHLVGLIQVMDNKDERTFTYPEIALAQLLANQAASALENAKLYKLAQQELAERIKAEEELRKSEANLKAIFDNSLQAFILLDLEHKVQAFNKTAGEGIKMISGKEIRAGDSIYRFIPEVERGEFIQCFTRVAAGESIIQEKNLIIAGAETWTEYHYNPVFSEEGQVVGICFSTVDIDERKRAADTLAASEARLLAEMQSVLSVTRALVSETHLNMLLDFIVTQAKYLLKTDGATVLLLSEDGQYLQLAARNDPSSPSRTDFRLPLQGSLAELALASHTVQSGLGTVDDYIISIRKLLGSVEIQSLLCAPLEIQGQTLGVLLLWNKDKLSFTERNSYLVHLFADQAALALYNARLHIENRRLAVEQERQRLARDLHDSVTQSLYSIGLAAQASLRLLDKQKKSKLQDPLKHIHSLSQIALAEMREHIYDLHPTALRDRDLQETLRNYCESLSQQYGLVIDFVAEEKLSFSLYQRENLYYIAREALWNVVKYAGETQVQVKLFKEAHQFVLSITDEGPGFALPASQQAEMVGLRSMEERAKMLMGSFKIHSQQGAGTQITVRIPVQFPQQP